MAVTEEVLDQLTERARAIRSDIITMVAGANSGHPGGSLSAVEIMTTLYFQVLRVKPEDPLWQERDRLILSKGHASPLLYAALAEKGFFPKEQLAGFRKMGSPLQGHPSYRKVPGVEASTGSLGQGLSMGLGLALAARIDRKSYRVYVLLGDGECEEGQVWEAAMAAAHYQADNLTAIIDHNRLQIDGPVEQVLSPEPLPDKWRAFGWAVREVNGHSFSELLEAFNWAKEVKGKPAMIIAQTIKGKGVSFMENQVGWHGKAPNAEQARVALEEIEGGRQ